MPPPTPLSGHFDSPQPKPPSTAARLLALICGPALFVYVAAVLSLTTGKSFAQLAPWVLIAGLAITVVLALLAVRLVHSGGETRRFSLSTFFLIAIPLGIQLAGARAFWIPILRRESGEAWERSATVAVLIGLTLLWLFLSTVVLLCFAEAVAWLALKYQRKRATPR